MGTNTSIASLQADPSFSDIISEAIDLIMEMETTYNETVTEVSRTSVTTTQVGTNSASGFMVATSGTSINLSQTAILDTVLKTTFYANILSDTNGDTITKFISADMTGMTSTDNTESEMTSFTDGVSLLWYIGIIADEATIDNNQQIIIYTPTSEETLTTNTSTDTYTESDLISLEADITIVESDAAVATSEYNSVNESYTTAKNGTSGDSSGDSDEGRLLMYNDVMRWGTLYSEYLTETSDEVSTRATNEANEDATLTNNNATLDEIYNVCYQRGLSDTDYETTFTNRYWTGISDDTKNNSVAYYYWYTYEVSRLEDLVNEHLDGAAKVFANVAYKYRIATSLLESLITRCTEWSSLDTLKSNFVEIYTEYIITDSQYDETLESFVTTAIKELAYANAIYDSRLTDITDARLLRTTCEKYSELCYYDNLSRTLGKEYTILYNRKRYINDLLRELYSERLLMYNYLGMSLDGVNDGQLTISLADVYSQLIEIYIDAFSTEYTNINTKITTLTTNIDISTTNVASNEINITTDNDTTDCYVNIDQYNESRVELIADFEDLADGIVNLPSYGVSSGTLIGTTSSVTSDVASEYSSIDENMTDTSETTSTTVDEDVAIDYTFTVIIAIVAVLAIGFLIWLFFFAPITQSRRRHRQQSVKSHRVKSSRNHAKGSPTE